MRLMEAWPTNAKTAMKMMNSSITLDVVIEPLTEYVLEYSTSTYSRA
jgi:hypothetical protein